jgi:hypothetical protein
MRTTIAGTQRLLLMTSVGPTFVGTFCAVGVVSDIRLLDKHSKVEGVTNRRELCGLSKRALDIQQLARSTVQRTQNLNLHEPEPEVTVLQLVPCVSHLRCATVRACVQLLLCTCVRYPYRYCLVIGSYDR